MKRLILCVYLILGMSLLGTSTNVACDAEEECKKCVTSIPKDFNFLKTYPINMEEKKYVEFSYVLTKGTDYLVNVCDADGSLVVTVFNSNRVKVASSEIGNKVVPAMAFACSSTGIYYLKYSFLNSVRCGGSTLSFKRKS